jgi:hypothetical protein
VYCDVCQPLTSKTLNSSPRTSPPASKAAPAEDESQDASGDHADADQQTERLPDRRGRPSLLPTRRARSLGRCEPGRFSPSCAPARGRALRGSRCRAASALRRACLPPRRVGRSAARSHYGHPPSLLHVTGGGFGCRDGSKEGPKEADVETPRRATTRAQIHLLGGQPLQLCAVRALAHEWRLPSRLDARLQRLERARDPQLRFLPDARAVQPSSGARLISTVSLKLVHAFLPGGSYSLPKSDSAETGAR